jgi:hypothetical protein
VLSKAAGDEVDMISGHHRIILAGTKLGPGSE